MRRSMLIALALTFTELGCAHVEADAKDQSTEIETAPLQNREQRLLELRGALREARTSRYATLTATELDRAEMWLGELDRGSNEKNDRLLFDAVEGQISTAQAFYARKEAEDALAATQATYAKTKVVVTSLTAKLAATPERSAQ
ncbi:MAG: hypothetical protein IPK13_09925 [Deltaproteobacteria bacterium]|nr:hypothetical protein [Deltaproteobacteria bacterium]